MHRFSQYLPILSKIHYMFKNKKYQIKLSTLLIAISVWASTYSNLLASDLAKEQRMRDQVADFVMDGDSVFLNTPTHEFLSIYMPTESALEKGTVIILHGRGFHPNWPQLIFPLRTGLTEHGWNTLSIQMPVLNNDASFYDYLAILPDSHPRINAAIQFIQQKKPAKIILLAHSCGIYMGVDWLHKNPKTKVDAFIGIGMGPTDYGQPMLEPFPLQDIKIPVLDIHGANDYPAVLHNASRRWKNIQRAGNSKSQQQVVKGADHYFNDRDAELLNEIVSWLNTL